MRTNRRHDTQRGRRRGFTLVELPFDGLRTVSKAKAPGFTLVELLVVISIIGVLLATLLPTLARIRTSMLVNASQAIINQVDGAVRDYYNDHEQYPANAGVLVSCVAGKHWKNPDNHRMGSYGPYNGTDGMGYRKSMVGSETDTDNGTGASMFHDAFGNPILYFRFHRDTGTYVAEGIAYDTYRGLPSDLDGYLKGEGGAHFRQDYVLITPGANGEWERHYSGDWTGCDDQNNFLDN